MEKHNAKGSFNTEEWNKLKANMMALYSYDLDYTPQMLGNALVEE